MSDEQLQRDIALVQATIAWGAESAEPFEAWQRIRARLTPHSDFDVDKTLALLMTDRWRVARAIAVSILGDESYAHNYLPQADAAIAAMGEP